MSNQEFYGGNPNPYPPQQPYGAPPHHQYPQQPQYGQENSPYPPASNYGQNAPYPPQNLQPPYGAPGPSPAHSPSPYGAPPPQQSPYGVNPYPPPTDPYGNPQQQLSAPYADNRGYSPAPAPYGAPAPTYTEPGANVPPQLDANGQPISGDRGLVSMGLGAAGGWGVASQTGRGTMGKILYAAGGMMAGQFLGNKIKKYRKDHSTGRDVEYYEDEHGREVSPPRDGGALHPAHGHGGYEEERHGRHHEHEHHGHEHHGHEHRSHSRHSSHSHGRHHDDDRY